jgi:hypothetical protein
MLSFPLDFATDWSNQSFFMAKTIRLNTASKIKSAEKENHDDDDETNNQEMMRYPPPALLTLEIRSGYLEGSAPPSVPIMWED